MTTVGGDGDGIDDLKLIASLHLTSVINSQSLQ